MTESKASKTNTYLPLIAPGLLLLFLLSTSIRPISLGYDLYNDKRILEIVTLILVNLTGLFFVDIRKRLYQCWQSLPRIIQIAIPSFFALGTVSALRSSYPLPALADVANHLSMLTAGLVITSSYLLNPKQVMRLVASGIVLLVFLSSFIELIGFITHWASGLQPNSHSMYIYFAHPRFFNQIQSWLLPLIFLLPLVYPKKHSLWTLSIVAAGCWWGLLFFSGGRGSSLGLLIALILSTGIWFYKNKRNSGHDFNIIFIRSLSISLALGICLFTLLIYLPGWLGLDTSSSIERTIGRDLSTSMGRFSIWSTALTGFYENYWFGIGPGLYSCLTPADYYPAHPHNGYLQILS
ncbi:MAG: O-antigen ligase family protein, partial [Proteobacteria bacterium]|nr:O-antigen ligase family protein [Pseudomonadota bacterium]